MITQSRKMIEMSGPRCWELLRWHDVGRLAVGGDRPDIFPVNYRVASEHIVIRTAEGQKFVAAAEQNVAFEVDSLDHDRRTGWSIVIRGLAQEPLRLEQHLEAIDLQCMPWEEGEQNRFLIITPVEIRGREIPKPGR